MIYSVCYETPFFVVFMYDFVCFFFISNILEKVVKYISIFLFCFTHFDFVFTENGF